MSDCWVCDAKYKNILKSRFEIEKNKTLMRCGGCFKLVILQRGFNT